jgi:HNH endonuclease
MASGCWEWQGYRTQDGYGQFWDGEAQALTHRWSYEHHVGPIPNTLVIDHLCRNPPCVNPTHLECVPMKTNTERGYLYHVFAAKAAAQTHCKRGHPLSGENLRIDCRGDRACRACQRMKGKEWKTQNQERVNELQRIRRLHAPTKAKPEIHRICPNCQSDFVVRRRDQLHCSSNCMKAAWRKRQPTAEKPDLFDDPEAA